MVTFCIFLAFYFVIFYITFDVQKFWELKGWVVSSIIASIWFGVASFFLGEVSDQGIVGKFLMSFGYICSAILYMIFAFAKNYIEGKRIWSFTDNDWIKKRPDGTYSIWYSAFFGMILWAIFNWVGSWLVMVTFQESEFAGVNQGVMSSLFVLNAVFWAIFPYVLLRESMTTSQYVGLGFMVMCAILLSFAEDEDNLKDIPVELKISPLIPVLGGIASSFGFGMRGLITKYYWIKGYNLYNFVMQAIFLDGLIGSIGLFIEYEESPAPIYSPVLWLGVLGGFISGFGILMINYAIVVGVGGAALAMANLASVIQTLLDLFILVRIRTSLVFAILHEFENMKILTSLNP